MIQRGIPATFFSAQFQVYALGNLGATETINWANGQFQEGTQDQNVAITHSNMVKGTCYQFEWTVGAGGGFTMTWVDTIYWDQGAEPTWTTVAGETNIARFYYNGSKIIASGWTQS
jgi:hypothetical protein